MAEAKKKTTTAKTSYTAKDIEENKVLAALSYLWIISLVILLVKKDSPFAQFHAKQGLVLFIAFVLLGWIPVLGWLFDIVLLIAIVVGFIQALSGKAFEIPGVHPLAKKINI